MGKTKQYSAFISHSSKDVEIANQLVAGLESRGLTAWISSRDIPPGTDWTQEIMNGLRASKCLVLLFSSSSELSKHVSREVSQADKANKLIIPVRIEDFLSDKFDYVLDEVQWISALEGIKDTVIEKLTAAINRNSANGPPRVAARQIDDPFSVPIQHTGPNLPPPSPDEVWRDTYGKSERKAFAELKTGENSQSGEMNKIAWAGENSIIYGGNKSIFGINVVRGSSRNIFSVPNWRGRYIGDFCVSAKWNEIYVDGNTFSCIASNSGTYRYGGYLGIAIEKGFVWDPKWNRVLTSPDGDRVIHTGLRIGHRSKNLFKRFLNIPDQRKRYESTHHYDILESATRLNDPKVPPSVALTGDEVSSWGPATKLMWSPSGNFISFSPRGLRGGYVTVFEPSSVDTPLVNENLVPLSDPDRVIGCLTWHPTREIYACGYWSKNEVSKHGFIVVDANTRKVIHERPLNRSGETTSMDWSPDGKLLALGGGDNAIFVWDFSRDTSATILGHGDYVTDVFFSPDGQRLISNAGSETIVWNPLNPGTAIAKFDGRLGRGLRSSPWSPSGKKIMMFSDGGVRVVELQ